jgi:hypothetical protein
MIPAGRSDEELTAWIAPRLEIVRHSIQQAAPMRCHGWGDFASEALPCTLFGTFRVMF